MIMLILACLDVKVQMSVGEEVSWKLGSKTFGPYNEIEIGIVSEAAAFLGLTLRRSQDKALLRRMAES